MTLELKDILEILGGLGTLIAVYVNLSNRITKLESTVETNKANISKLDNILNSDLKEMKEILKKIEIDLAVQKTMIENNENK